MKKVVLVLAGLLAIQFLVAQRQLEQLDRGLIAVKTSSGVYVGWRITGQEWLDASYKIYRNGTLIAEIPATDASNYRDAAGIAGDKYQVAAVMNGVELEKSPEVSARNNAYYDIMLDIPAGGTTPDNVSYTYTPNDASTADLDGDGDLEIILKWDPSNSKDNSQSGYTGNVYLDAYTLEGTKLWRIDLGRNIRAGAHYTQFLAADFDGDGKAEVVCKTADGTVDGLGNVIGSASADYRNSGGYILSGPEYLTVFNGETGEAMSTIDYQTARGSVTMWGDSYGNRVDRFLACVAYLDGEHPSIVMTRGYYRGTGGYKGRTGIVAYDFLNGTITQRWSFLAVEGGVQHAYTGQGNHNLSVADVDNDGKDEIIYGAMTLDDDGIGLYTTGLFHGDALHVSDMDPDYPGLEVFSPHEDGGNGVTFREAETGKIIWQYKKDDDVGRGVAADILSNNRGFEAWATSGLGMYNAKGTYIGSVPNSMNFRIFWDDDLLSELMDGTTIRKVSTTIFAPSNVYSNNGSKSTPTLTADLFGDWREEVIWRYYDASRLRIFTTTIPTEYRLYTLMHDQQYRNAVAWENAGYNQPPHQGFYMEPDMALPVPVVFRGKKWKGNASSNTWDVSTTNFIDSNGNPVAFAASDTAIFSFNGTAGVPVVLSN